MSKDTNNGTNNGTNKGMSTAMLLQWTCRMAMVTAAIVGMLVSNFAVVLLCVAAIIIYHEAEDLYLEWVESSEDDV